MLDNYIGIIYNTNIMKHLTVIDTNVILSALKSKVGKSHELVLKIGSGAFDFAISVPLILEYEAVLKKKTGQRTLFRFGHRGCRRLSLRRRRQDRNILPLAAVPKGPLRRPCFGSGDSSERSNHRHL